MKRLLLFLGPALSIAGAMGLTVFGTAIVETLDGVLTYRITDPPDPLPASLVELRWVAMSGMALAFGLAASCVAMVLRDSRKTMALAGRTLASVAGLLLFIGTMLLLWGLLGAKKGFMIIAASPVAPKPEDVQEMVAAVAPLLTVGCAVLLTGSVLLLVAGQLAVRPTPSQTFGPRSMPAVIVATGSVLLGTIASLLFVAILSHGGALEAILAGSALTPKPSELARHLAGILNKSLLAFIGVGCQGVLQAMAAIFAPRSTSRVAQVLEPGDEVPRGCPGWHQ